MLSYVLLLVAASTAVVTSQSHWGEPCTLYPEQDPHNQLRLSTEIPSNCTQGTINWDWPRGNLTIHLSIPGSEYRLCLVNTITLWGQLFDLTSGVAQSIPLPTKGHDACASSINGETRFLVLSAKNQYYYSTNDYIVVPK